MGGPAKTDCSIADVPAPVLADLRRRYDEPQRAYHSWAHIEALLKLFDECKPLLRDPLAVLYAILFHDAVYDPTRGDNEDRSVDLLRTSLATVVDPSTIAWAAELVLATKKHGIPDHLDARRWSDAAIFLDMDLSILGSDDARFDRYEDEIRAEYPMCPMICSASAGPECPRPSRRGNGSI